VPEFLIVTDVIDLLGTATSEHKGITVLFAEMVEYIRTSLLFDVGAIDLVHTFQCER